MTEQHHPADKEKDDFLTMLESLKETLESLKENKESYWREEYNLRLKEFDKDKDQCFTEFHHEVVLDLFQKYYPNRQIGAVLGASYVLMLELGYKLVKEDK